MYYALDVHVSGDFEVFNLNNTMVEGILEDINKYKENTRVKKEDKKINLYYENKTVTYFLSREDRKKEIMGLI